MMLEFLAEFMDFGSKFDNDIGERIANVFRVGDDNALTVAQNDVARDTDDGGVVRYAAEDDGAGADAAIVSDGDVAQDLCAGADHDAVAQGGMALAFLLAGAPQGNALIEGDVVTHNGGFPNDGARAVVDEEAASKFGSGMDFDPGEQARHLGEPAGQEAQIMPPQPVGEMVCPNGMQSGIAEEDFQVGARRRV